MLHLKEKDYIDILNNIDYLKINIEYIFKMYNNEVKLENKEDGIKDRLKLMKNNIDIIYNKMPHFDMFLINLKESIVKNLNRKILW